MCCLASDGETRVGAAELAGWSGGSDVHTCQLLLINTLAKGFLTWPADLIGLVQGRL